MTDQVQSEAVESQPWTFLAAKWYGYVFSAFFLLYGGVKIILGVLDRDYDGMGQSVLFLVLGILMISICLAFRDQKAWGWYGLVGMNGLIVIFALLGYAHMLNLIYLVLSLGALVLLFLPRTKAEIF